jgi:hypothetical protein
VGHLQEEFDSWNAALILPRVALLYNVAMSVNRDEDEEKRIRCYFCRFQTPSVKELDLKEL